LPPTRERLKKEFFNNKQKSRGARKLPPPTPQIKKVFLVRAGRPGFSPEKGVLAYFKSKTESLP
jgi:hypothetical protein